MDPNRMTEKSREALQQAQTLATRHPHQQVDNEHLLLALLEQEDGAVAGSSSAPGATSRRSARGRPRPWRACRR